MNARNTIAKTFACSLLALTATFAWASDGGKPASDLSDTSFEQEPSVEKYFYDRDAEFEQRVRETAEETSAVGDGQVDHSGDGADPTGAGEIDRGRELDRIPAPPDVKLGDLNSDDLVNEDDILIVVNAWGNTCKESPKNMLADIAPEGGDCIVDFDDLLVVLLNFGS